VARILIVEDEALIAMLVEDAIVMAGHQVVGIATAAAAAIALADREAPDLVLCDVHLRHGESGLHVAAALADRRIPCLFVSGKCPDADAGRGIAIGCMVKPFRPTQLQEAISAALASASGHPPDMLPPGMTLY